MPATAHGARMLCADFEEIAAKAPETVTLEFLGGRISGKAAADGNRGTTAAWLVRRFLEARPELFLHQAQGLQVSTFRTARARPDGVLAPAEAFAGQGPLG